MTEGAVFGGRSLRVFHRDTLWRPLEDTDPPDSFYDFTEDDYHRVVQSSSRDEAFKTRAVREREEQEAAAALSAVRVRYVFPEGLVCETEFSALDTVDDVVQFLAHLAAATDLRLFTTPPKTYLQKRELTLFRAKLVPHVHLFVEHETLPDGVSALKPAVLAFRRDPTPDASTVAAPPPPVPRLLPEKRTSMEAVPKPVPKWFKMGRK